MIETLKAVELSWCAGFFDGEGCISAWKPTDGKNPLIQLAITQCGRETLARFCEVVGGSISGPYRTNNKNHSPYHAWRATGIPNVIRILSMLWPYLSDSKREQAKTAIQNWATLPIGVGVKVGENRGRGSNNSWSYKNTEDV